MCTEYVYTLLHTVFMCFLCFYGFSCFFMFLHEKSLKIDVFAVRGGLYNDHPRCGYLRTTPRGKGEINIYLIRPSQYHKIYDRGPQKHQKPCIFDVFGCFYVFFVLHSVHLYVPHPGRAVANQYPVYTCIGPWEGF